MIVLTLLTHHDSEPARNGHGRAHSLAAHSQHAHAHTCSHARPGNNIRPVVHAPPATCTMPRTILPFIASRLLSLANTFANRPLCADPYARRSPGRPTHATATETAPPETARRSPWTRLTHAAFVPPVASPSSWRCSAPLRIALPTRTSWRQARAVQCGIWRRRSTPRFLR